MTYSVDGVELPGWLQMIEAEGVDVLVDGQSNLNEQVHDHETLGTDLEGQDLDSVGNKQTGPGKRVSYGEDPDHGNDSLTSGLALLSLLLGRADCPNDEGETHGGGCSNEHRATADTVNKQGAGDRNDERKDCKTAVETKLSVTVCNTDTLVNVGGVVGDEAVAGPLGEQTEGSEEQEPVPVALGLEEVEVGRALAVEEFKTEGLLDLGILELNGRVVDVAVGVVLAQHGERLFVALLGDQPTRRLGDPVDENELDDRGSGLGKGRNTPAPVVVNTLGAECQPCADNGTNVPETVVDGRDTSAVLRMADFSEQQRRRKLSQGVAETHEETSTHEVVQVLSRSLNGGAYKHNETSTNDCPLSSESVGDEWSHRKRGNGTDRVESSQETKSRLLRVIEVEGPLVENSQVVQHGTRRS
jgi:hypothetical protein